MTGAEIVLIITLGYSPSGASGVNMTVLEYVQPDMAVCVVEQEKVTDYNDGRFDYHAMCVNRSVLD